MGTEIKWVHQFGTEEHCVAMMIQVTGTMINEFGKIKSVVSYIFGHNQGYRASVFVFLDSDLYVRVKLKEKKSAHLACRRLRHLTYSRLVTNNPLSGNKLRCSRIWK